MNVRFRLLQAALLCAFPLSAANCPIKDIGLNENITSTLSTSNCRLSDLMGSGSAYAEQYRVTLTQRGSVTVEMTSSAVDAFVYIVNSRYSYIDSDDNTGGGSNSRLLRTLDPGTYIIIATAQDRALGSYSLRTMFRNPQICPIQDVGTDTSTGGSLGATDCRLGDVMLDSGYQNFAKQYRVTLNQRGTFTADMVSTDGDAYVYLLNSRYEYVDSDDNSGGGFNARIFRSLEPGNYVVVAVLRGAGSTGTFQLRTRFRNPQICPIQDVGTDASANGSLGPSDCRLGELMLETGYQNYARQYRVALAQRGALTAEMFSTDADAYLYLLNSRYEFVDSNDNSAGGFNARILRTLDPGTYIVIVTLRAGSAGNFQLSTRFRNPQLCPIQDIGLNASVSATLSAGDCRLGEVLLDTSYIAYAKQYRITLTRRGTLTVEMSSGEMDAYLYLVNSRYEFIDSDNDSAGGSNARVFRALDPGVYVFVATNRDAQGSGYFTVATKFRNPQICPIQTLAQNDALDGYLSPGDCRVGDILIGSSTTWWADQYRITVPQTTTITVDQISSDFDSYLYLVDSAYNFIDADDNSGAGQNARITRELRPGTYVIVASARSGAQGSYSLKIGSGIPLAPGTSAVLLLLHGLGSNPSTWDDFVNYEGVDCPSVHHEDFQFNGATLPAANCYRYGFSTMIVDNQIWDSGDGATYDQLGEEVKRVVDAIAGSVNPSAVILVGHSRGGLAARAYLQSLTSAPPFRLGLLTIGTPHQGSPFGRIGHWLQQQGYGPDDQVLFKDSLRVVYSPSVRYLASAFDANGQVSSTSVNAAIRALNAGAARIANFTSTFGQITSGGLFLGDYPLPFDTSINVLSATPVFPGGALDMVSFVLQNIPAEWASYSDGIVPLGSQRLSDLPGFENKRVWELGLKDNDRVFHTSETGQTLYIHRVLQRMLMELAPSAEASIFSSTAHAVDTHRHLRPIHHPDKTLSELMDAIRTGDRSSRASALHEISTLGAGIDAPVPAEFVSALQAQLPAALSDVELFASLARTAVAIGTPDLIETLFTYADRNCIPRLLRELRNPQAIPYLVGLLMRDPELHEAKTRLAGDTLAAMGGADATEALLKWAVEASGPVPAEQAAAWFAAVRDTASLRTLLKFTHTVSFADPAVKEKLFELATRLDRDSQPATVSRP